MSEVPLYMGLLASKDTHRPKVVRQGYRGYSKLRTRTAPRGVLCS